MFVRVVVCRLLVDATLGAAGSLSAAATAHVLADTKGCLNNPSRKIQGRIKFKGFFSNQFQ